MSDSGIQRIYRHESTQYTTVPNWVVRDPEYSPNAFRLLAYLLSHADGYELTYSQIERQTTLGRYAINQAAKFLIDKGWLEWDQKQGSDGRWLAKTWILRNPIADYPSTDDSGVEPFHYGTINGHKEEQLLEKNTNKETHSKTSDSALFDAFWEEYPKKEGKKPAFKAFQSALKRATFEDILAAVIRYKSSDRVHRGFIMLASRFLNEDHWEDHFEPAPGTVAAEKAEQRKQKERDASDAYLRELEEQAKNSVPPPKCKHGESIARCMKCLK